jgi:hypothetical protein
MTLHVYVEGMTPYEVEDQWMVKARDAEGLSGSIPVKVDREDPQKVAIDWDGVRAELEQEKEQRRAALTTQGPVQGQPADPFATFGVQGSAEAGDAFAAFAAQGATVQNVTPVVDMRNDPELRAKIEAVLGRTLTPDSAETIAQNDPALQMRILRVVQEHMAQQSGAAAPPVAWGTSPPPAPSPDDADPLARLERLAALRASGALTEEEFQAQKRKLLGAG